MKNFYGKFRAFVTNIKDPQFRGRIKVRCPKAYGESESPWCLPCTSSTFDNGGMFYIPRVDEMIWVEFEEGDTNYPIWVGGLWKEKKSNLTEADYDTYVGEKSIISTKSGHKITLCDKEGERFISIEDINGNLVKIDTEIGDITIEAKNDINLRAGKNVNTLAGSNINENAGGNITENAGGTNRSNGAVVHHN